MKQQDRESVNFEEIVQKTINVEAKVGLKSIIMVRDLDIHCFQGHYPSKNTVSKVQTKKIAAKNFSPSKEPKTKDSKSIPPHDNTTEPATKKDKQKRFKR